MRYKNCYRLETTLPAGNADDEFGIAPIRAWVAQVRSSRLQAAIPQFILKLDRLSRTAIGPTARVAVLQELKRPLLKAAAGLPKPVSPGDRAEAEANALTLEQRLYCLMAKNLRQALQDVDSFEDSFSAEMDKRRHWTVRNLFRFLARQIEFSVFWSRPVPTYTWQTLHDLYSYVTVRGYNRPRAGSLSRVRNTDFDPQREYMGLLLLGLAAHLLGERQLSPSLLDQIGR